MSNVVTTIDLLKARRRAKSKPGQRDDSCKVALAIEGGGMRGVVSGGMVSALELMGLGDAFDVVYGSSAGAMAGAYFLAGQARYGTTIYYQDINNADFISLRRGLTRAPIMRTEFLLDHVCRAIKPLATERILASGVDFGALASSITERRAHVLRNFTSPDQVFEALRASVNVPGVAGPPVPYGDDHYVDAALYQPIPFRAAVESGATHVLALLTRPHGVPKSRPSPVGRAFMRMRMRNLPAPIAADYIEAYAPYNAELAEMEHAAANPAAGGPQVHIVRLPTGTPAVGQAEKNRDRLVAGAVAGCRQTMLEFGVTPGHVLEVIGVEPAVTD